jgi:hypothetical protein
VVKELAVRNQAATYKFPKERRPTLVEMQEYSTLILPEIAGVNPVFIDPRLVAEAANRIRAFTQVIQDTFFLFSMGLDEQRSTQVAQGEKFT